MNDMTSYGSINMKDLAPIVEEVKLAISMHRGGSLRKITEFEIEAMTNIIKKMLEYELF